MTQDENKTQAQLIAELQQVRKRIAEIENAKGLPLPEEDKLKESEERFRNIMEQSPLAIEILTPDGQIIRTNPAWMHLWGLTNENAARILEKYNMLRDERIIELGIMPQVEKAFAGESVILPPFEYDTARTIEDLKIKNAKARKPWIQCHLYPVKSANGEILNIVNMYEDITERKKAEEALRNSREKLKIALDELEKLKDQIEKENIYLQEEIKLEHNFGDIIGRSTTMKKMLNQVEQVATTGTTVLILGETGTGKELAARAIHGLSKRKERPLVKVNCAALPSNLIESELFGHEKGAFTGATAKSVGRFELANGGTIFLDEIGELPLDLQSKLLRVLQDGEFERLGSSDTIKVDTRVIAATNRNLEKSVLEGDFRQDLYYRLNVFPIICPPLRERPEDISVLVKHFVNIYCKKIGKTIQAIPNKTINALENYTWPGNVRELENIVERGIVTTIGNKLQLGDWFKNVPVTEDGKPSPTLNEHETDYILNILEKTNWRIRGKNGAAQILGLKPTTLESRIERLGIKKQ